MQDAIAEFEIIIRDFSKQILEIDSNIFSLKLENKWSKKEILGHLIDSAIINYLRFIEAQFKDNPQIFYQQNEYCQSADYAYADTKQLCNLWDALNQQLLFLFKIMIVDKKVMEKCCNDHNLAFLMQDYVSHLKHHKRQILDE